MQLRQYQLDFIQNIKQLLSHSKHVIACAATGSGKTKTFLSIASNAAEKKTTVLILTESTKIFSQIAAEKKTAYCIKAGVKYVPIIQGNIYIAMAQTLAKRTLIINQFQALSSKLLIINDEAHIGTSTKLLKQLTDAYLIGFTATPDYKSAKHLPEIYKGIVVGAQPQELVEMGYLSPYYHYMKKSVNLDGLEIKNGEFTEQSQFESFGKKIVFDGLQEDLKKYHFKKAIIFCSCIKHAATLAMDLRLNGYLCSEVHSKNPSADIELSTFINGDNKICVSVGVLTKGFDFPKIDLIVIHRATTSLPLYCQMVGRGSRVHPQKTKFTVLDYGENAARHGLWNFEHDWATLWMKPSGNKKKKEGVSPVKECPKCFLLVSVKAKICTECGHIWDEKQNELIDGEMVSLTDEYDKLRGKYIADLSAQELYSYTQQTNKKAFAKRIAQAKGHDFLMEYASICKWKHGWNAHIKADESIPFTNILIR